MKNPIRAAAIICYFLSVVSCQRTAKTENDLQGSWSVTATSVAKETITDIGVVASLTQGENYIPRKFSFNKNSLTVFNQAGTIVEQSDFKIEAANADSYQLKMLQSNATVVFRRSQNGEMQVDLGAVRYNLKKESVSNS